MDKTLLPLYSFSRNKKKKERIFEIDFLRGFAVLLMVIIHGCWVFGYGPRNYFGLLPKDEPEWYQPMARLCRWVFLAITQPGGSGEWKLSVEIYMNMNTRLYCLEVFWAGMFMFLSGISCSFSKSNFKRGMSLFLFANLLSLVLEVFSDIVCGAGRTPYLTGTGIHIWCGILHAIAIGILLYSLFDHFFKKWWQTYLASIVLTILCGFAVYYGFEGGANLKTLEPVVDNAGDFFMNIFYLLSGLRKYGDDYFSPLLVTTAIFLGATVGKTFYKDKKSLLPSSFKTSWGKPICFMGRHSLIFYIGHEVGLIVIMTVMFLCMGYSLKF